LKQLQNLSAVGDSDKGEPRGVGARATQIGNARSWQVNLLRRINALRRFVGA
jgi:hypothetical protein